uniref:THO complex subunit 1 n=1 Tax=Palpitomonas bilix TaxID=652834 RepID=A0A7S3G050_9EUKA|mmetsp:Transcript_10943/g.28707  ORF Transcript_10943/g.28707 Transcript_10943/m.28707 type:complete len:641 (+) Transcript_10943:197-2119(+)
MAEAKELVQSCFIEGDVGATVDALSPKIHGDSITPMEVSRTIRSLVLDLVEGMVKEVAKVDDSDAYLAEKMKPVFQWFDVLIMLSKKGSLDMLDPFLCIEDVFDAHTLEGCTCALTYLEEHIDVLKQAPTKAQRPLMRMCNQLLRRISKANNTMLCGRTLMLLAQILPIHHGSGTNPPGTYHDNETTISDNKEEKDQLEEGDESFYKAFWGIQSYVQNPLLLMNGGSWGMFGAQVNSVLHVLEAEDTPFKLDKKHKEKREFFYSKFLTSRRLIGLQVKDHYFRRHVLVQLLIFFKSMLGSLNVSYLKRLEAHFKEESRKKVLRGWCEKVEALLKQTNPEGGEFASFIASLLQREESWVKWKEGKCQNFEKKPVESKEVKAGLGQTSVKRTVMGNTHLSQLWANKASTEEAQLRQLEEPERNMYMPASLLLDTVRDEMDPDMQVDEDVKSKNEKNFVWMTMRSLSTSDFKTFVKACNEADLEKLLKTMDAEKEAAIAKKEGGGVIAKEKNPADIASKGDDEGEKGVGGKDEVKEKVRGKEGEGEKGEAQPMEVEEKKEGAVKNAKKEEKEEEEEGEIEEGETTSPVSAKPAAQSAKGSEKKAEKEEGEVDSKEEEKGAGQSRKRKASEVGGDEAGEGKKKV